MKRSFKALAALFQRDGYCYNRPLKPLALVVLDAALLGNAPHSRKLQPLAWFPLRSDGSVVAIAAEIQGKPLWFDLDTGAPGGVQLVGNAIWRRFNVVFDLSRSVMYLTPRR